MSNPLLQRCCRCIQIRPVYAVEGTQQFCKACWYVLVKARKNQSFEKPKHQEPKMTEEIPDALSQHLAQAKEARSPQEIRDAIQAALTELQSEGKPFTLAQLLKKASVSNSTFYSSKYADLRAVAKEAIAQLKGKTDTQTPDPTYTALQVKIQELTQANRGLELRNKQLRQQLQEQVEAPPRLVEVAMPLTWLEQQAQAWRDTVADYQAELEQIQADIAAAQANLEAFERLISLHDVATPVTPVDLNVTLNGHNSNGTAIDFLQPSP